MNNELLLQADRKSTDYLEVPGYVEDFTEYDVIDLGTTCRIVHTDYLRDNDFWYVTRIL